MFTAETKTRVDAVRSHIMLNGIVLHTYISVDQTQFRRSPIAIEGIDLIIILS